MNYYPFHLGDYAAHTAHLEPMEDLAYRRMLDLYYRTEKPLPFDTAAICRLIRMKGHEEAVDAVLDEFFENMHEGWVHVRCEAEIARMQDKQAKAKASAQASVNARSANAQRTLSGSSAKVELPTPTPTPTPKEKADSGSAQAQTPPPAYLGEANESEIPDKARVPLASGWELPAGWGQDAEALGWRPDEILRESEKFRQYYVSGKGADTRRGIKGWRQSWSNWLSNAEKFTPIRRIA